jgi:thiamine biosynthesis lipoprotein ApbE
MALDQEAGWALVRREAIAALFIARETGGFTDRASPEFERHLVV